MTFENDAKKFKKFKKAYDIHKVTKLKPQCGKVSLCESNWDSKRALDEEDGREQPI